MLDARVCQLLEESGCELGTSQIQALSEYAELVRRFQPVLSLVSHRDLPLVEGKHIPDALSLVGPIVRHGGGDAALLDLGTGAGFPAIPLKVALPGLEMVLVERQTKRVGFLQKVIGALSLKGVRVVEADFPRGTGEIESQWVTARAVEKPEKVAGAILERLPIGAYWLAQMGHPKEVLGERFHVEPYSDTGTYAGLRFHVEPWVDNWSSHGLRRGHLWLVTRVS